MMMKNEEIQFEHSSSPYSPTKNTSSSNNEYELVLEKCNLLVVTQMLSHAHEDIVILKEKTFFIQDVL